MPLKRSLLYCRFQLLGLKSLHFFLRYDNGPFLTACQYTLSIRSNSYIFKYFFCLHIIEKKTKTGNEKYKKVISVIKRQA